jgi:hypothetical protein
MDREAAEMGLPTFADALFHTNLLPKQVYTNLLDIGIYAVRGIYHAQAIAHDQGRRFRLGALEGTRGAGRIKSFGVDTGAVQ